MTNTTPAPIGADALREAAYGLIEACERDWPSTPRHRAAVLKHAAALRAALASAAQPARAVTARYDLSPAAIEGAIRDKLIEMGWTPPDAAKEGGA